MKEKVRDKLRHELRNRLVNCYYYENGFKAFESKTETGTFFIHIADDDEIIQQIADGILSSIENHLKD